MKLNGNSKWLLRTFMNLGTYSSHEEIIECALEALYEKELAESAKEWDENSTTPEEVMGMQLEVRPDESK